MPTPPLSNTNPILRVPNDGDHLTLNEEGVSAQAAFTASAVAATAIGGLYWTFSTVDKSKSFNGASGEKNFYVWYNVPTAGVTPSTDPVAAQVAGAVGIPVTVASAASAADVRDATATALAPLTNEIAVADSGTVGLVVTQRFAGDVADPDAGTSGFTIVVTASGVARVDIDAKFTNRDVNGAIVSVEDPLGSTYDLAGSTYAVQPSELFGGWNLFDQTFVVASGVGIVLGSAAAVVVKSDNRPLFGVV
jgi:hypothetical protein